MAVLLVPMQLVAATSIVCLTLYGRVNMFAFLLLSNQNFEQVVESL